MSEYCPKCYKPVDGIEGFLTSDNTGYPESLKICNCEPCEDCDSIHAGFCNKPAFDFIVPDVRDKECNVKEATHDDIGFKKAQASNSLSRFEDIEEHNHIVGLLYHLVSLGISELDSNLSTEALLYINHLINGLRR